MILHYAPGCPHSNAVRLVLLEKGIDCGINRIDLAAFQQHTPGFLALGSKGLVPVLEYDGQVMIESFPLMLFIDETFPDNPLRGTGPQERYRVLKWGKYVETHIAPNLAIVRWTALNGRVPQEAIANLALLDPARAALWKRAADGFASDLLSDATNALRTARERLANDLAGCEWLAGDEPTLADFAAYPHMVQYGSLGLSLPEVVSAWIERMRQRPSLQALKDDIFPLATMGPERGRWG